MRKDSLFSYPLVIDCDEPPPNGKALKMKKVIA